MGRKNKGRVATLDSIQRNGWWRASLGHKWLILLDEIQRKVSY